MHLKVNFSVGTPTLLGELNDAIRKKGTYSACWGVEFPQENDPMSNQEWPGIGDSHTYSSHSMNYVATAILKMYGWWPGSNHIDINDDLEVIIFDKAQSLISYAWMMQD